MSAGFGMFGESVSEEEEEEEDDIEIEEKSEEIKKRANHEMEDKNAKLFLMSKATERY